MTRWELDVEMTMISADIERENQKAAQHGS